MYHLRLGFALAVAMILGTTDLQARPQQLPGNTYIYPQGTIGYYVGNYRSPYYVIPPVNNGFYGLPYGANYYQYPMQYNNFRNNYYMNYPGFYQQPYGSNSYYGPQR